jgi:peptidoglycan/xylan/chitin deacetylase (PgdA/CDA1 family)
MESSETVSLSWPDERAIYLTLDLECDYGTALPANTYEADRETDQLVDLLERYSAPLSCFVQTEVLEEAPTAVRTLAEADVPVSFHAHSHTHPPRAEADVEYEVRESVARVQSEFETEHIGYRFPDGDAYPTDYEILGRHGVSFSSTLFPSWRPGRFNNARRDRKPFRHRDSGVVELPFTVQSDLIRIPVSISYLKFLGRGYDWLVRQDSPTIIIFDMHMHDLVVPSTFADLPRRYKLVYARHKHDGFAMLDRLLDSLQSNGYRFGELTELYERVTGKDDE